MGGGGKERSVESAPSRAAAPKDMTLTMQRTTLLTAWPLLDY